MSRLASSKLHAPNRTPAALPSTERPTCTARAPRWLLGRSPNLTFTVEVEVAQNWKERITYPKRNRSRGERKGLPKAMQIWTGTASILLKEHLFFTLG